MRRLWKSSWQVQKPNRRKRNAFEKVPFLETQNVPRLIYWGHNKTLHTGTVCTSFGGFGCNACLLFAARLSLFGLQNCYISFCILQSHCYLFKIVSVLLFCQKLSLCWYFVQNCPCFCCKNHNARALSDLRCFCCNLYLAKSFCHFQPAV